MCDTNKVLLTTINAQAILTYTHTQAVTLAGTKEKAGVQRICAGFISANKQNIKSQGTKERTPSTCNSKHRLTKNKENPYKK